MLRLQPDPECSRITEKLCQAQCRLGRQASPALRDFSKSIAWWNLKILNNTRLIDHAQLAPGSLLDIPR